MVPSVVLMYAAITKVKNVFFGCSALKRVIIIKKPFLGEIEKFLVDAINHAICSIDRKDWNNHEV